jgi:hypothetical protein
MGKKVLPWLIGFLFPLGCIVHPQHTSKDMDELLLLQKLDACPPWASLDVNDQQTVAVLMRALAFFQNCDYDVLRKVIARYVTIKTETEEYDVESASRLFILNRYLFNVPEIAPISEPHFGGWVIPHDDRTANRLWPFRLKDGQLILIGGFQGYFGAKYDALGEFDFFRKVYGLRTLPK